MERLLKNSRMKIVSSNYQFKISCSMLIGTAVSKKPKGIQDEIVTDERGKRRFHGAFTGGFSAGYFNTVGTKHGF